MRAKSHRRAKDRLLKDHFQSTRTREVRKKSFAASDIRGFTIIDKKIDEIIL